MRSSLLTQPFSYRALCLFWTRFLVLLTLPLITISCSSTRTIVNGLDEREANEIIVFLAAKGIDATKVPSTEGGAGGASKVVLWDIKVNENQALEAMSLLNQAGLPRRRGQSLLNIFASGGLVPSELQEKIRYQAGLAEQISSTIRKIDGVLDAEVQISFPEENPLNPAEKKGKITASVYVKHNGVLDDPNAHLVTKLKRLVAASVPGLDFDNVTVVGDRVRFGSVTGGGTQTFGAEDSQVRIWSITLAKESVTRFRIIFFTFVILLILLLVSLGWLGWKTYPLLKKHGGLHALLHTKPISTEEVAKTEAEKGSEAESKDKTQESDESTKNPPQ